MKQILRYFVLFTLVLMSIKASADDRVVIASLTNGTITVDNANPTGAATVTLTVTPAEGYYITAEDIKVQKTTTMADSRSLRSAGPAIADNLTVSEGTVDDAGKGTYTFSLPEGYGAYVTATFTECTSITGAVITVTDNSKVYNGAAQSAETISVTLGGNAFTNYTITENSGTNAGSYNVTIQGTGHYKGSVTKENAFTITPKEVGITWIEPFTFTDDGEAHVPTATATGLCNEDVCTVTVSGAQTNVGEYTATASSLDNGNYKLPTTGLTHEFSIINGMSVTLSEGQNWASYNGTADYVTPEGLTAYVVTAVSGNTVTVASINYVPANTPVLLMRNENTTDGTKTGAAYTGGTSTITTNLLKYGQPTALTDYVLKGNEFVLWAGDNTSCVYLPGSNLSAGSRSLSIEIGDATAIRTIKEQKIDNNWYTIKGTKINNPQNKGVYIHNGKKIIR